MIFSLVVVALAAYVFFFEYRKGQKVEEQKEQDAKVFAGLKLSDVQNLVISPNSANQQMDIKLEKKQGGWHVVSPVNDVADNDAIEAYINTLLEEKTQDSLGEESADLKTYGLDQPKGSVTLGKSSGDQFRVSIGSVKAYDGSYYAQLATKPGVFLVSSMWGPYIDKKPNEFRNKKVKRGLFEGWDYIVTQVSGKQRLELKKVDGEWQSVPESKIPLQANLVEGFIYQLVNLEILDFVSEMKTNLNEYGLSNPQVETRLSGMKDGKPYDFKLALSPKSPDGKQYATATSSDLSGVVKVYSAIINVAGRGVEGFFDRKFPFQYDPTQAVKVRVATPELKLQAEKRDGKWVKVESSSSLELSSLQVEELTKALSRMEASGYLIEKGKGLSPAKNLIEVQNDQGEILLSVSWGDEYRPNSDDPADTGLKFYYATTSKVSKYTLSLKEAQLEQLPIKSLHVEPAKAAPAPTATKEATP